MLMTRRTILRNGSVVLASVPVMKLKDFNEPGAIDVLDELPRQLADAALSAASDSGADYSDVRVTHSRTEERGSRMEVISVGIRSLKDGYWGFASSNLWDMDDAARLGRESVRQAIACVNSGFERSVDFAPVASFESGSWRMPVKDDPFRMSQDEIGDFIAGLSGYTGKYSLHHKQRLGLPFHGSHGARFKFVPFFRNVYKLFASSSNQYCEQETWLSGAEIEISIQFVGGRGIFKYSPAGLGFEYFRESLLREEIAQTIDQIARESKIPVRPVDVGRYNVLFDSYGVADMISKTIGVSTEIDRVFGYEANAGGTSYIVDPENDLGQMAIGNERFNVSMERQKAGGASTVKWDDEGVVPAETTLVDKGRIVNLQTSREGAGWIKPLLEGGQVPYRSTGNMHAEEAEVPPLVQSGNLHMKPGNNSHTTDSLLEVIEDGLFFEAASCETDMQQMTGYGYGNVWEIKKGKKVARLPSAGLLFRTSELWKSIQEIGGTNSVERYGKSLRKGEPSQGAWHSVYAPPMLCKELTIIDKLRKA